MKREITAISIAIALLGTLPAYAGETGARQSKKKSASAETSTTIPWPFQINWNGYKLVKGKQLECGQTVSPGTSVTVEGQDKETDAANRFVAQLVSERWEIKDMPAQKEMLWGKTATRGPWEAVIVSEPTKAKPSAKLWRTRLEVRANKNYDGSSPPVNEMGAPRESR